VAAGPGRQALGLGRPPRAPGDERLGARVPVEGGVLAEDRHLQLAQLGAGLDAQALDQRPPRLLVGPQCVRLAARAVLGRHEQCPQPLPGHVGPGERHEVARRIDVPTGRQQQLGPQLLGGEPQLVEPHGVGLERGLGRQVAERPVPPQVQRLAQPGQRPGRRARGDGGACVGEQGLEQRRVHLAGRHVEQVARRPPHHRGRGPARLAGPQQLAQLGHVGPQRAGAGARRVVAPDRVDQRLGRHDAAGPQHEVRQHRPLAGPAERDLVTLPPHGQGTEDVKRELAVWHRRARPTVRPASGPRSPGVRTP
jgi:hypothetical protein